MSSPQPPRPGSTPAPSKESVTQIEDIDLDTATLSDGTKVLVVTPRRVASLNATIRKLKRAAGENEKQISDLRQQLQDLADAVAELKQSASATAPVDRPVTEPALDEPLPATWLHAVKETVGDKVLELTPAQFAANVALVETSTNDNRSLAYILRGMSAETIRALVASVTVTAVLEHNKQRYTDFPPGFTEGQLGWQCNKDVAFILNALGEADTLGNHNSLWYVQAVETAIPNALKGV